MTTLLTYANWLDTRSDKAVVPGSSPGVSTNCYAGNSVSRPACEIEKLVPRVLARSSSG